MPGCMFRPHRKDARPRLGQWMAALTLLCAAAWAAGLATPAHAAGCKGVPKPDKEKADRLRQSGRYDALERMLASYRRAYQKDPYCEPLLWEALGAHWSWHEADRASFDRWVAARPDSWAAHTARGVFWNLIGYQRRGEAAASETTEAQRKGLWDAMKRAEADLRRAVALDPRDVVAYGSLIDVLKAVGRTREALAVYRAALSADPLTKGVRVHMLWAAEPEWGGSVGLMKKICGEALAHEKQNPRLHEVPAFFFDWVGASAWRDRRYADAVRAFREAQAYVSKEDGYGWSLDIANVLHQSGDDAAAIHELGDVLASHPKNTAALTLRSSLLLSGGHPEAALADAEKAEQLEPRNADAWKALASADAELSRWEPAVQAYAKLAALSDDKHTQVWALQQRAEILAHRLRKPVEAEASLQSAARLDPAGASTPGSSDALGSPSRRGAVQDAVAHFLRLTDPSNPQPAKPPAAPAP